MVPNGKTTTQQTAEAGSGRARLRCPVCCAPSIGGDGLCAVCYSPAAVTVRDGRATIEPDRRSRPVAARDAVRDQDTAAPSESRSEFVPVPAAAWADDDEETAEIDIAADAGSDTEPVLRFADGEAGDDATDAGDDLDTAPLSFDLDAAPAGGTERVATDTRAVAVSGPPVHAPKLHAGFQGSSALRGLVQAEALPGLANVRLSDLRSLPPPPPLPADIATGIGVRGRHRRTGRRRDIDPLRAAYEEALLAAIPAESLADLDVDLRCAVVLDAARRARPAGSPLPATEARQVVHDVVIAARADAFRRGHEQPTEEDLTLRRDVSAQVMMAAAVHLLLLILIWGVEFSPPMPPPDDDRVALAAGQEPELIEDAVWIPDRVAEVEPMPPDAYTDADLSELAELPAVDVEDLPEIAQATDPADLPETDTESAAPTESRDPTPAVTVGPDGSVGAPRSGAPSDGGGMLRNRSGRARDQALRRFGGTPEAKSAVEAALQWLKRQQLRNGSWYPAEPSSEREEYQVGYTALALLCFIGAGHTHTDGDYQEVVQDGVRFLLQSQRSSGVITTAHSEGPLYNHAVATLFLCELYAMTREPTLLRPCERAVDFLTASQQRSGGWDYTAEKESNRSDMSITGFVVMALKSARIAGIDVKLDVWKSAYEMTLDHTLPSGEVYYSMVGRIAVFRRGITMAAVGALSRMYLGEAPDYVHAPSEPASPGDDSDAEAEAVADDTTSDGEEPRRDGDEGGRNITGADGGLFGLPAPAVPLRRTMQWILSNQPDWSRLDGRADSAADSTPNRAGLASADNYFFQMYYIYYATLAMFEYTGGRGRHWREWNENLLETLIPNQNLDTKPNARRDIHGSWTPHNEWWDEPIGRHYVTCLAVLTLEVYYRYLPLYTTGGELPGRLVAEPDRTNRRFSEAENGLPPIVPGATDVPTLIRVLQSPAASPKQRSLALDGLIEQNTPAAREAIADAMMNRRLDDYLRSRAIGAVGDLQISEHFDKLLDALTLDVNRSDLLRGVIYEAIGEVRHKRSFDVLLDALRMESNARVARSIAKGLNKATGVALGTRPSAWENWRARNRQKAEAESDDNE
jgi:hypothetical protein